MTQINVKKRKQRIAYKGEEEYYVTSSVTYSKIPTEELLELASENSGIAKAQMSASFYALEQQIRQFLFNGHAIQLSNLGYFYLGTNAHATTEEDKAGADAIYRIAVKFRQSKSLRTLINSNVKLTDVTQKDDDEKSSSSTDDGSGSSSTGDGSGSSSTGDNGSSSSGDSGNSSSGDKELTL